MHIAFVRGMWGMDQHSLAANLRQIKEGGYEIVEMGIPADPVEQATLRTLLDEIGLDIIAQQWTNGHTPEEHSVSFTQQYCRAVEFGGVLFVNSHTGKDHFTYEESIALYQHAAALETEYGLPLVHEIHRGRATYSAPLLMNYFDALPDLKVTADFSHWCCVHESLLEDQNDRIERAIQRTEHIHARVGHSQGSQITDPRDPMWNNAINAHLTWWDRIVEVHQQRGSKMLTICPEFGPWPYMTKHPHTHQDIVNLWDTNLFMKNLLADRYDVVGSS